MLYIEVYIKKILASERRQGALIKNRLVYKPYGKIVIDGGKWIEVYAKDYFRFL